MPESQLADYEADEDETTSKARLEAQEWAKESCARLEERLTTLLQANDRKRKILSVPDVSLVTGEERWYSAAEAATFFARTPAWIYDRLAKEKFTYKDGTPIKPRLVGDGPKPRRRFNLDIITAIARSMYRDGTIKMEEFKLIMRRIAQGQFEEVLYDPDLDEA